MDVLTALLCLAAVTLALGLAAALLSGSFARRRYVAPRPHWSEVPMLPDPDDPNPQFTSVQTSDGGFVRAYCPRGPQPDPEGRS
ncbi:hypothetical protein J0H58_27700 [bacterium]|nr:hypothetical protein [bacterium]